MDGKSSCQKERKLGITQPDANRARGNMEERKDVADKVRRGCSASAAIVSWSLVVVNRNVVQAIRLIWASN